MSLFGKVLDIFGPGGSNNSFYARDFRNAYTFRPDQNPPRQKFQGYVNFVLNRSLYGDAFYATDNAAFRVNISSLVRTASLPEMQFKTDTKNRYNRKKIVNTGVEYEPVDIKVFDTINNDWLILFMKYYSYHYMNPRNKSSADREVGDDPTKAIPGADLIGSKFGKGSKWDSNAYGYNLNAVSNFFERIDYVIYHGNKGIQYSLFNPVLTRFRTSEIDYSSSEVMEFDMTFEYESFTIYDHVQFGLSEIDVARFENAKGYTGPAFVPIRKPLVLGDDSDIIGKPLAIIGDRDRPAQPQAGSTTNAQTAEQQQQQDNPATDTSTNKSPTASDVVASSGATASQGSTTNTTKDAAAAQTTANKSTANEKSGLPSVYGNTASFATPTGKNKGFIEGLLGKVADSALTAAIHGGSIKNAVISTAAGGIVQGIVGAARAPTAPTRAAKSNPAADTSTASTAEKTSVKPGG